MREALRLAARARGRTAPNPMVGSLVVGDGARIASGHHVRDGATHAEALALERAGARARGATLYVTLEPCAHHGRTPPCVDAVLASGVRRVVIATLDPDPRTSGRSVERLRAAGLEVVVGVEEPASRALNCGFESRLLRGRPHTTLKLAASLDGRIATRSGDSRWITGERARAWVHELRNRVDAIAVGSGTALADDPELTCRLPGLHHRSPIRVVLDSSFRTPASTKMVRSATEVPVIIFGADGKKPPAFGAGVSARQVPLQRDGCLDLAAVLRNLSEHDITRVMVEGGPMVARAFLDADLVDEVVIAQGTKSLGASGRLPLVDRGIDMFADASRWDVVETRAIGADRMTSYHRHDRFAADERP